MHATCFSWWGRVNVCVFANSDWGIFLCSGKMPEYMCNCEAHTILPESERSSKPTSIYISVWWQLANRMQLYQVKIILLSSKGTFLPGPASSVNKRSLCNKMLHQTVVWFSHTPSSFYAELVCESQNNLWVSLNLLYTSATLFFKISRLCLPVTNKEITIVKQYILWVKGYVTWTNWPYEG